MTGRPGKQEAPDAGGLPPWLRRAGRALLLGLWIAAALGVAGLLIGLATRRPWPSAVMWAEVLGGTLVCAVAALLLLWRPRESGQTAEREQTADVGFGLMLAGLVAFATGLLLSWLWRL